MAKKGLYKRVTKEWAKHLRKWGKKDANGRNRTSIKSNSKEEI